MSAVEIVTKGLMDLVTAMHPSCKPVLVVHPNLLERLMSELLRENAFVYGSKDDRDLRFYGYRVITSHHIGEEDVLYAATCKPDPSRFNMTKFVTEHQ